MCAGVAAATCLLLSAAALAQPAAAASAPAEATAKPPVLNSNLDAALFYQLLIGEIELGGGHAGNAYQILLDAARRTRDEELFRRATEIALHARAGDQALTAASAWRTAHPESLDALRLQLQILLSMNRTAELAEPPPTGPAVANAPGRSRIALVGAALVTLVALVVTWWATHRPSDRLANVAEAPGGSWSSTTTSCPRPG